MPFKGPDGKRQYRHVYPNEEPEQASHWHLISTKTNKVRKTFKKTKDRAYNPMVLFGRKHVLIAGTPRQSSITVLSKSTLGKVAELSHLQLSVWNMVFSPDQKLLAGNFGDGEMVLWKTKDWKKTTHWNVKNKRITAMAFHPKSKLLAVGNVDGEVQIWKTDPTPQRLCETKVKTMVRGMGFHPDGKRLFVGLDRQNNEQECIQIFDLATD